MPLFQMNKVKTKNLSAEILLIFQATIMLFSSNMAFADGNKNIEDVLERLEKKIIQSEAPTVSNSQPAEQTIDFKPKKVTTDTVENRDLNEISKQTKIIGQRVEQLEADLQKTRQKVLDDAKLSQSLAINLLLLPRAESFLRSARVFLDGYEIYGLDQPQGLWTASETLPLYVGPTQTGPHKLDLEISVIHRADNKLALNAEQFQTTHLVYPFSIENGHNVDLSFAIKPKKPDSKHSEIILEVKNNKTDTVLENVKHAE